MNDRNAEAPLLIEQLRAENQALQQQLAAKDAEIERLCGLAAFLKTRENDND